MAEFTMITHKLDNALRQVVADAFKNLNYPCYHSSYHVWGAEAIIDYPEYPGSDTYSQLCGKLKTYKVSLPVDENTDLQALAKEFVRQAEEIEHAAYNEALGKWSETYPIDILRETMECHELCGWSLLAHEGEGVVWHGKATAVHYALYLPNMGKLTQNNRRENNFVWEAPDPRIGG